MRFVPKEDNHGHWGVHDNEQNYMMPGVHYPTHEAAEAFADRLNAINEGEPNSVIEELRRDSDALR